MKTNTLDHHLVNVSPSVWPGPPLDIQPGDLTRYFHLDFTGGLRRQERTGIPEFDPLRSAPVTDSTGGVLYLDEDLHAEDMAALLRLTCIAPAFREYAVFADEAENAREQGYLVQCRLMPAALVRSVYGANLSLVEGATVPQPLPWGEFLWAFIENQKQRWTAAALEGRLGGDGDSAREKLAFGFLLEDGYHKVFRIWSRIWLETK